MTNVGDGGRHDASINKETTQATATPLSSVEGDSSNGGPKAAAALLSLGQDLTKGPTVAAVASAVAMVPASCGIVIGANQGQQHVSQPNHHMENTLELVATGDIPMLPTDIEPRIPDSATTIVAAISTDNDVSAKKRKKRKRITPEGNENDQGDPPDLWHWLAPEENIGNWDVLCGRGGESNNFIGNKRYRKVVCEKKEEYRRIDVKQRKMKTNFVREIVQHIQDRGGRFIDIGPGGKYYVVTNERARKKTSQALRETKELKWLVGDDENDKDDQCHEIRMKRKKNVSNKDAVCPFCGKTGHKTKIAKACLKHHEWLHGNSASDRTGAGAINNPVVLPPCRPTIIKHLVDGNSTGMNFVAGSLPLEPSLQNKGDAIPITLPRFGGIKIGRPETNLKTAKQNSSIQSSN